MAPRRNYHKIPVIDKTRLRESFNRGEDFLQLAKILGINRTTAYSIVNRDQDIFFRYFLFLYICIFGFPVLKLKFRNASCRNQSSAVLKSMFRCVEID